MLNTFQSPKNIANLLYVKNRNLLYKDAFLKCMNVKHFTLDPIPMQVYNLTNSYEAPQ